MVLLWNHCNPPPRTFICKHVVLLSELFHSNLDMCSSGDSPNSDCRRGGDSCLSARYPGGKPSQEQRHIPRLSTYNQSHHWQRKSAVRGLSTVAGYRRPGDHCHFRRWMECSSLYCNHFEFIIIIHSLISVMSKLKRTCCLACIAH